MLPKRILCPIDFSAPSYVALDQAIDLAIHFEAELGLLHVVALSPPISPDLTTLVTFQSDDERLESALAQLREVAASRVPAEVNSHCEVKMGHADKEIAVAIEDGHFDWLVIATHGLSGFKHLVFGSVAEAIVRQVRCPVLTVHGEPDATDLLAMAPIKQKFWSR